MASAAAVIFLELRARDWRSASATGLVEGAAVCAWANEGAGAKARARSEQAKRFMEPSKGSARQITPSGGGAASAPPFRLCNAKYLTMRSECAKVRLRRRKLPRKNQW